MSSFILVTGSSGFVGQAVTARLAADGHRIVVAAREAAVAHAGVETLAVGDLSKADWRPVLTGCSTVVHCAARAHVLSEEAGDPLALFRVVNRDATLVLARAAAEAGVRRFVFLSSIGVNGNATYGRPFRPDDAPAPHSLYAVAKWEAEQGLAGIAAETDLEVVTIRPPLVLGRDPKGNLGRLVSALRRGVPLPLGAVTRNRRDLVSLDTLTDLIVRTIDHPNAPGAPLLISDGAPLSTLGVIERLAKIHGLRPRLLAVPPRILGGLLNVTGRRDLALQLLGDLQLDIGETCRRLDWRPPQGATA